MSRRGGSLVLALALASAGCFSSSGPIGGKPKPAPGDGKTETAAAGETSPGATASGKATAPAGWEAPAALDGKWVGYPDLPYVPITNEVEGVDVPRTFDPPKDYVAGGEVQVDAFNAAAKGKASAPVDGGSLSVRFNAEPKSLNPITETSSYQTYILSYVQDALAWQNPETFEYEPFVAKSWVVEDSVKLRSDFAGRERRVALGDAEPAATVAVEVTEDEKKNPKPVALRVVDKDGKPVANAWVGMKPEGGGAVEHFWTGPDGTAEVAPPAGKYAAVVGDELYGKLEADGDGYVLKPLSKAGGRVPAEPVKLAKADVIDVQRETVFTYLLRDDVTWSDGAPFTADDLKFAYSVINNPTVDGDSIRVYYADVVDLDVLDPHAVRMKYRKQYFLAFEFTANLAAYTPPLHKFREWVKEQGKELVFDRLSEDAEKSSGKWSVHGQEFGRFFNKEDRYGRKPLGIGPYVVDEWSQQDRRVVVKRRKDYWNKDKGGHLDRIIFKFIEDNPTALQALRSGEIDFMWVLTPEQFFEELEPAPDWVKKGYVKAQWFSPGFSYAGWNSKRPYFADPKVRLALAMLFDKKDFFEKKMHRAGVLVSGSQYYFGPGYDHSVGSVGYDPQAARDLLAEAGWIDTNGDGVLDKDGVPFRFKLLMPPGNPTVVAMAELMQRAYKQAGIDMQVQLMEWASFVDKIQGRDFDMVTLSWASSIESDPYQLWHGSQAKEGLRSSNYTSFANPLADSLIDRIRVTLDKEERRRLFYDFHRVLDREQPYMFLWTRQELGVYAAKFRGVKFYALRPGFDLREWYLPKEYQ